MRRIAWFAMGVVVSACGRSPLLIADDGIADEAGEGDERGGAERGNDGRPDDDDEDDDDDVVDEGGAFVPPPDLPQDTVPDPSCGNGVIDPGELCYLPRIGFPSRIDPCAIAVGDLNDDGHLDVVVPNSDFDHLEAPDNYVSVLLGDGDGNLGAPIPFLAGGDYAVGVSIADLDGDGIDDLVVANSDARTLTLLRGTGPAVFGTNGSIEVGDSPVMAALADLDFDGDLDIAVTNAASHEVHVSRGYGTGAFGPATAYPVSSPWELVIVDISGDGRPDIASTSDEGITLLYAEDDGEFSDAGALTTGLSPLGLVAADLDGNGWPDLVSANAIGSLSVWMSHGSNDLESRPEVPVGSAPRSIAPGDFDMDGKLDLAIADDGHPGNDVVHIVQGNGAGDLQAVAVYTVGDTPSNVRAGDFNEDGVLDLVTSDQYSNEVGMLLSNP